MKRTYGWKSMGGAAQANILMPPLRRSKGGWLTDRTPPKHPKPPQHPNFLVLPHLAD